MFSVIGLCRPEWFSLCVLLYCHRRHFPPGLVTLAGTGSKCMAVYQLSVFLVISTEVVASRNQSERAGYPKGHNVRHLRVHCIQSLARWSITHARGKEGAIMETMEKEATSRVHRRRRRAARDFEHNARVVLGASRARRVPAYAHVTTRSTQWTTTAPYLSSPQKWQLRAAAQPGRSSDNSRAQPTKTHRGNLCPRPAMEMRSGGKLA